MSALITSSIIGGISQDRAAGKAADAQTQSAEAGIAETRRQFDESTKLFEPFLTAGTEALAGYEPIREAGALAFQQQQALSGLLGPAAQSAAIRQIEGSGEFQALTRQGEEALLQRASATGGLRGGNIQAALAQFRPQMLSAQIEQQLGRLGGFSAAGFGATSELAGFGQAAAAKQAAAGQSATTAISNLFGQQGQAAAGAALARGQAFANIAGQIPAAVRYQQSRSPNVFGQGGRGQVGTLNPSPSFGDPGFYAEDL